MISLPFLCYILALDLKSLPFMNYITKRLDLIPYPVRVEDILFTYRHTHDQNDKLRKHCMGMLFRGTSREERA